MLQPPNQASKQAINKRTNNPNKNNCFCLSLLCYQTFKKYMFKLKFCRIFSQLSDEFEVIISSYNSN